MASSGQGCVSAVRSSAGAVPVVIQQCAPPTSAANPLQARPGKEPLGPNVSLSPSFSGVRLSPLFLTQLCARSPVSGVGEDLPSIRAAASAESAAASGSPASAPRASCAARAASVRSSIVRRLPDESVCHIWAARFRRVRKRLGAGALRGVLRFRQRDGQWDGYVPDGALFDEQAGPGVRWMEAPAPEVPARLGGSVRTQRACVTAVFFLRHT